MTTFLMCEPGPVFATGTSHHDNFVKSVDVFSALRQHRCLQNAIQEAGTDVLLLGEAEKHPNSVFVRDPVCCLEEGVIVLRMGLISRRGEEAWHENFFRSHECNILARLEGSATAEGGDIIVAGRKILIGNSVRTNAEGVRQVIDLTRSLGYEPSVISVPRPYLHLGGMLTVLSPETILCSQTISERIPAGLDRIIVRDTHFFSGNVVALENYNVLLGSANIEVAELLALHKYQPIMIDLSEFIAGYGGPSCLFQPLRCPMYH